MIILQVFPFSGDLQSTAARNPRSQRPRKKSSEGIFECVKVSQVSCFLLLSRHLEHTPFTPVRWRWSGVSFRCLLIIPRVHGKYLVFNTENPMKNEHILKNVWMIWFLQTKCSLFFHSLCIFRLFGDPRTLKSYLNIALFERKRSGLPSKSFFRGFCCKFVCWGVLTYYPPWN